MTKQKGPHLRYDFSPDARRTYYLCEKCEVYFYEEDKTPNLNMVHRACGDFAKLLRFEGKWSFADFTDDRAESVRAEYEDYLEKKESAGEIGKDEDEWSLFEI